ncbi:MAG: hypothetical protein JWO42_2830 [Chloroflexi bacterium]|nr:hypothetical protein [Chloroflexota bacterium]
MTERPTAMDGSSENKPLAGDTNTLPVVITIAVLAIMAVVIAIDASSVPALAGLAIIALGAIIAGIVAFG